MTRAVPFELFYARVVARAFFDTQLSYSK